VGGFQRERRVCMCCVSKVKMWDRVYVSESECLIK
jgi:hypothetical protein